MATRDLTFDRVDLFRTLNQECFGESGSSTVIVGGRKVGKSHLLKHIQEETVQGQEYLYCPMDLSALKAEADGSPSDQHFLRFFLARLLEQIDHWIVTTASSAVGLVGVANKIRTLSHQVEPLKVYELAPVLATLKTLDKRIILVIDEYDRFLKEPGFTKNLFNFLRGANNEGKIITLVSSSSNLMDSGLHPQPDAEDRKSLFNHFKSQFIVPFSVTEAEMFLDWLHRDPSRLKPNEKAYLLDVGGGSPHFLKVASQYFLAHGRPQTVQSQRDFEGQFLREEFSEPFRQMWERVSDAEREALLRVANGGAVGIGEFPRLEREGYLIRRGTKLRIFSRLFTQFVKDTESTLSALRRRLSPTAPNRFSKPSQEQCQHMRPKVSVTPRFQVCPTALYLGSPEYAETVHFNIENPTGELVTVQFMCQIVNYSNEARDTCEIEPGKNKEVTLFVTFDIHKMRTLNTVVATDVRYQVILRPGASQDQLLDKTQVVRLLPLNNFLMARYDPNAKCLHDFTWLISAWVNRDAAGIDVIRQRAAAQVTDLGSPLSPGEEGRKNARARVEALYQALRQENIVYSDRSTVFHQEANDYIQEVRKPDESLKNKAANCLDGSVLFASLLDLCGLTPGILLLPGHALVGWKDESGLQPAWEFLETTAFSREPFTGAFRLGQERVEGVRKYMVEPDLKDGEIADPKEFAILIDVNRIRRQRKIIPI